MIHPRVFMAVGFFACIFGIMYSSYIGFALGLILSLFGLVVVGAYMSKDVQKKENAILGNQENHSQKSTGDIKKVDISTYPAEGVTGCSDLSASDTYLGVGEK